MLGGKIYMNREEIDLVLVAILFVVAPLQTMGGEMIDKQRLVEAGLHSLRCFKIG
jgi:hypothetical protein